jgi:gamma-glutamylcyclotransferase (GGCT)/AIG2-like uncharacterized protein YtfP
MNDFSKPRLVFAYGSNLCWEQMRSRCPSARFVERASLPRVRLIFGQYSKRWGGGVAGLAPDKRSKVNGVVYAISVSDMLRLDKIEGHPGNYLRIATRVHAESGRKPAVYVYALVRSSFYFPPSLSYERVIRAGLRTWELPSEPLDRAIQRSIEEAPGRLDPKWPILEAIQ